MTTFKTTDTKKIDRTKYIGGSDAGAICGVNIYQSPLATWRKKTGRAPDDEWRFKNNPHIDRGVFMEDKIEELVRINHDPTVNSEKVRAELHQGDPDDPQIWLFTEEYGIPMGGHPDGVGEEILWEFKAPTTNKLEDIKANGPPKSWVLQVLHYMLMADRKVGKIAMMDYNNFGAYIIDVVPSEPLMEQMLELYRDFWFHVEMDIEPAMGEEDLDFRFTPDGEELDPLLGQYKAATTKRWDGKREQSDLRGKILSYLGDSMFAETDNWKVHRSLVEKKNYSYERITVRSKNGEPDAD